MRKLFLVLASAVVAQSVAADEGFYTGGAYRSDLTVNNSERFVGGEVSISGDVQSMKLKLDTNGPFSETFKFENVKFETTYCGIVESRAMRNDQAFDGPITKVLVRDFSNNWCFDYNGITVKVKQESVRIEGGVVTMDSFYGPALELIANPVDQTFEGEVVSAYYAAGTLTLGLRYGGGFEEHKFDLKWGACDGVVIYNAEVKRCEVEVLHLQGKNDPGRAWINDEVEFKIDRDAAYLLDIQGIEVLVH